MKVTRQSIIEARRNQKRQKSNKIWTFTAKAAFVLFTSAVTLSHISTQTLEVSAQTTQKTRADFLNLVGNYAREVARKNDLYASVMVAQAILESGWGQSSLAQAPNYNLFGIKGNYNGETVKMDTLEDDGSGNYYSTVEPFRKYNNYGESLADYASILTGDNDPNSWRYKFYYGARISQTTSYQDATKHLTGRYATDTRYGTKLNELIETYQLTQYDAESVRKSRSIDEKQEPSILENKVEEATEKVGDYIVNAGDSYWRIANKYGITIAELQRLNGTNSLLIHPGQVLRVPATATDTQLTPSTSTLPVTSATPTANVSNQENPTPPSQNVEIGTYTVNAGDSYWRIANKYGITIAELQRLNGTNSLLIHPGQVLRVPATATDTRLTPSTSTLPVTSATPTANVSNQENPTPPSQNVEIGTYTVNAGDSYWRIANKYGITIAELQRLNGTNSLLIHPGQVLRVPATATDTRLTPSTSTSPVTSVTPTANVSNQENPTPPSQNVEIGAYTVNAGDSYWRIANKYGITIAELQRLNGTNSLLIHPGQVLRVPATATDTQLTPSTSTLPVTSATPTANVLNQGNPTPPSQNVEIGTYTVNAGDSYWRIANKYGITITELQRLNGTNSLLIHPGQVLRVPTSGMTVSQPSTLTPTLVELNAVAVATVTNATDQYTVQAGESYGIIAARYGITIEALQQMNGATSLLIHPGQVLRVPVR